MNEKSQVWRNASARYPITIEDNGVERMITEENARSLLRDLQGVLYPAMRADREIPADGHQLHSQPFKNKLFVEMSREDTERHNAGVRHRRATQGLGVLAESLAIRAATAADS